MPSKAEEPRKKIILGRPGIFTEINLKKVTMLKWG